jgi:hypothetical protein
MKHVSHRVLLATLPFLLTVPCGYAQPVNPPTQAEAQAALNPAPPTFSNAQLDQMLAPIALYPDQLLVQVLMAATFPQQLIDAGQWLQDSNNAALKGDDLVNALQPLPWDPSVKSLVAFPQIIAMLTDHLDWTEALGAAFANQQVETMARVQFLRERAMQAGQLQSTSQIVVSGQASDIVIEPTDPNMIYVPVYNPAEIYGTWPDSDAPPVYIPPPPSFYNGALAAGIGFSVGFGVVAPLWGWGHPDWQHHRVAIDPGRYGHITNENFITQNHINIEGGAWRRTGPIAQVPEAQRPHPPQPSGQQPAGTVRPSELARPGTPAARQGAPAAAAPHQGEAPHPAAEQPAAHPGETPHPAAEQPAPHPGEPAHPEEVRPGEPPHPAEVQHPAEAPHPSEAPHPVEVPHPAAEAPHPAPPPAAHPAEAPHPAAPPAAHPAPPPAKKPPPKPGEEEKKE